MHRSDGSSLRAQPEGLILDQDLSWLSFNHRVLTECFDKRHPLLERVRFLAISSANLDEFFRVRICRLKTLLSREADDSNAFAALQSLYHHVVARTGALIKQQDKALKTLLQELSFDNIRLIIKPSQLKVLSKKQIRKAFEKIYPLITPYMIDSTHPFPFIPNQSIVVIFRLKYEEKNKKKWVVICLPKSTPRFHWIEDPFLMAITTEMLIYASIHHIFPRAKILDFGVFRYVRTAQISLHDLGIEDDEMMRTHFRKAINQRRFGEGVQLMMRSQSSQAMKKFITDHLDMPPELIFESSVFVGMDDLFMVSSHPSIPLHYKKFSPKSSDAAFFKNEGIFTALRKRDILIHHPYDSFDIVVQFLKSAAQDPKVRVIHQTIYRTGSESAIIDALIACVEAGKTVVALVEIKARFDEEANLHWAQVLREAGVHVFYGVEGLKTHAKISLVLREEDNGQIIPYVHIGTGNYNQSTAKQYTDLSFFTSQKEIGQDVIAIFHGLTSNVTPTTLSQLVLSPDRLRHTLIDLINQEIKFAKKNKKASIWAKMNALTDPQIIRKLYEASQAGVHIFLIVRGICTLVPGVKGLSERITVKSIIGRFLEHARIFCFGNGSQLPCDSARVFISSADWMPRNFDRRIEIMLPITDSSIKQEILSRIMVSNINDTENSWILDETGKYTHCTTTDAPFNAQDFFMKAPAKASLFAERNNEK